MLSIASSEIMKTHTEQSLARLISEIRIQANVRVIVKPPDTTVVEVMHQESANAAVVFMGLQDPDPGEEKSYAARLERLSGDLPVVFFVKNSSLFIGELLVPEEEEDDDEPATENDESGERARRARKPAQEES